MEGASTLTIGGVSFTDRYTNLGDFDVFGGRNDTYRAVAPLTLEGPIRVTTEGGFFEIPGPTFALPAFVEVTGLEAVAEQGAPATAGAASANTGQSITLLGQNLTASTLVQFAARDNAGVEGVLTRTGSASGDGRRLTVGVPALAQSGLVQVVGTKAAYALQIVPTLRAAGGTVAAGQTLVLEGTGLTEGALTVTIDGHAAAAPDVRLIADRGVDQQVMTLTVPAEVSAGVISVQTAGGSFSLGATNPGGVFATAASGTAANAALASANPGQEIGVPVANADSGTRLTFLTIDGSGTMGTRQVAAGRLEAATQMAYFVVPVEATTGAIDTTHVGATNFTGFAQWRVTAGTVDLLGNGFYATYAGPG
jgi:hypothetical protein